VKKLTKGDTLRFKLIEDIMFAFFWICVIVGALAGFDCFIHPQAPPYVLFSMEKRLLSWPIYLFVGSSFTFILTGITSAFGFITYNLILFFVFTLPIIKNEMRFGKLHYKTKPALRNCPKTLITTWRSIEILVTILNTELFYNELMYVQGGTIAAVVFSVVTLIFQWDTNGKVVKLMMITFGVAACVAFPAILHLAGLQHKWSEQTIQSWKQEFFLSKKDWLYVKKFKRSCRPFSISDGRRYLVRLQSVLLFLKSVTRCTVRALITYRKYFGL